MQVVNANPKTGEDGDEQDDPSKLNLIISNQAEYFDLLFDLLNLGLPDVTSSVWALLMQIPVNKQLFHNM